MNTVIALVRPKNITVYARGKTTSKTTLRILLALIWFENIPHSNQSFDKTIGPTTDHRDQLMNISSFFNTHTRYPLKWTKSDKLLSSNSPSCCLAYPTSSGYPTRILGERVVYRKPTWSRDQHSGQATTWWYFREEIRNIMNHRYVSKLGNNLSFQSKTTWSREWGTDTILTH